MLASKYKSTLLLALFASVNLILFQNCGSFKSVPRAATDLSSIGGDSVMVERFAKAQDALNRNCVSCHSAGKTAGHIPLDFSSEAQFASAGLLVPGDVNNSKIIYRMSLYGGKNGRQSDMPPGGSISQADYDAIFNWVSLFGVPEQPPVASGAQFVCKTGSDIPTSELKRLQKNELRNTFADLLASQATADRNAILAELDALLLVLPTDSAKPFNRLANGISPEHIAAQYDIANKFGETIVASTARMTAFGGSCFAVASPTKACVDTLIDSFGLKAFRRPLTATEKTTFYTFYTSRGATGKQDLIGLFLLSPEFLYHLENQGTEVAGREDLVRLSGYEVASKISYHYWQSMPNTELFNAARDGKLNTADGIREVIDSVIFGTQKARTQSVILAYFNEWLKIESLSALTNMAADFKAFTAGENVGVAGYNHRTDMINEVYDLINYQVWDSTGSFNDLLTSDISFAKTDALAHVYGVSKYVPGGQLVRFPAGERSGILTRAALLVTGGVESNPIIRGVTVSRDILCNPLPAPTGDLIAMRPTEPPAGTMTTRDRVHNMTSASACVSCHSVINPIGFAFEAYDAFGRTRKTNRQDIYDSNGNVIASLPVTGEGNVVLAPGMTVHIDDAVDMSAQMAKSGKAQACFTRQYYRFAFRKQEKDADDGCGLQAMYTSLDKNGMREMFKEVAVQPSFLLRRIEK